MPCDAGWFVVVCDTPRTLRVVVDVDDVHYVQSTNCFFHLLSFLSFFSVIVPCTLSYTPSTYNTYIHAYVATSYLPPLLSTPMECTIYLDALATEWCK